MSESIVGKQCKQCGLLLTGRRNKNFCDSSCSREWHSREWHANNPKTQAAQLAVGTVGSMNVMRVMLDLVAKGYQVYRAAFEAMPFELVVYKFHLAADSKRVKVTTGHLTSTGTLTHRKLDRAEYGHDVLAVVVGTEIIYEGAIL